MMKKYALALLIGASIFGGCRQTDNCTASTVTVTAPAAEVTALKQYIDANDIAATADSRGFYYSIQSPGTGTKPTICSTVSVNYAGTLTNGAHVDSNNNISLAMANLIVGWQEGIPLIASGGSITLYLPPSLGYGANATGSIPANSILIFKIDLLQVN